MNIEEAIEECRMLATLMNRDVPELSHKPEAIDIVLNELRHKTKENKELIHKIKTYRGMVKKQGRELSKLQKLIQEKN